MSKGTRSGIRRRMAVTTLSRLLMPWLVIDSALLHHVNQRMNISGRRSRRDGAAGIQDESPSRFPEGDKPPDGFPNLRGGSLGEDAAGIDVPEKHRSEEHTSELHSRQY